MLQFALKIILCDSIPCFDFMHTNACTVFKNESHVYSSVYLGFFFPRPLPFRGKWTRHREPCCGGTGGRVRVPVEGSRGEMKEPEIKRARRKWGWAAKRWESMIR